jgi:uncharacterized delta-60 repeat protein
MGVAVQADGRLLVGARLIGDIATNGLPNYRVFRLSTNGVLDATYQSPVFRSAPRFLTVQPDGKLLVACVQSSVPSTDNGGVTDLVRLNSDGSLDLGFHRPVFTIGVLGIFASIVLDTNSAIYVTGGFTQVDGQTRQQIARLHPDGTLDAGFVPSGFLSSSYLRGVLIQPDGKVVIAGRLRLAGGSFVYYPLLRLNADGSRDPSFTLVPSTDIDFIRARQLRATPEGKLLTVGTSIARFNSDGSLDATFTRLPFLYSDGTPGATCFWFEQLDDGHLVVPSDPAGGGPIWIGGQPFNGAIRLLPDGSLDPAFSAPTFQQDIFPTAVAQQGQTVLVAGNFDHAGLTPASGLVRLNANGTPDPSFALAVSNVTGVLSIAWLTNQQAYVLVQGTDPVTFAVSNLLLRLQPDGAVDPSFVLEAPSDFSTEPWFADLLLQGEQPLLVASRAQALLYQANVPLVRFLADGHEDASFAASFAVPGRGVFFDGTPITDWNSVTIDNVGLLQVSDVQSLAADADRRLLVAVGTNVSADTYNYQIIRLNTNGTLDASFNGPSVPAFGTLFENAMLHDHYGGYGTVSVTYPVRCLTCSVIQSNGSIVFGGTSRLNTGSTVSCG